MSTDVFRALRAAFNDDRPFGADVPSLSFDRQRFSRSPPRSGDPQAQLRASQLQRVRAAAQCPRVLEWLQHTCSGAQHTALDNPVPIIDDDARSVQRRPHRVGQRPLQATSPLRPPPEVMARSSSVADQHRRRQDPGDMPQQNSVRDASRRSARARSAARIAARRQTLNDSTPTPAAMVAATGRWTGRIDTTPAPAPSVTTPAPLPWIGSQLSSAQSANTAPSSKRGSSSHVSHVSAKVPPHRCTASPQRWEPKSEGLTQEDWSRILHFTSRPTYSWRSPR